MPPSAVLKISEGSLDISLIHTGKEHCSPGHICSIPRNKFIIHFVLDGAGFYSAGGQTWSLTPGQMFIIYPNEPITYAADDNQPWTYAWIGFRGIRAHALARECGFSKNQLVLPSPDQKLILKSPTLLGMWTSWSFPRPLKRNSE